MKKNIKYNLYDNYVQELMTKTRFSVKIGIRYYAKEMLIMYFQNFINACVYMQID